MELRSEGNYSSQLVNHQETSYDRKNALDYSMGCGSPPRLLDSNTGDHPPCLVVRGRLVEMSPQRIPVVETFFGELRQGGIIIYFRHYLKRNALYQRPRHNKAERHSIWDILRHFVATDQKLRCFSIPPM